MSQSTTPDRAPSLAELQAEARRVGFAALGVAPVERAWLGRHAAALERWLGAGQHASMAWIAERATERTDPTRLLENARSAVALWLPHRTAPLPRPEGRVSGQVAAYAWGRDYHNVARRALRKLSRWLWRRCPGLRSYSAVDTGPVLERAFAERAGLGWIGKSSMLIHPRLGTWGSLAVLLTDAELPAAPRGLPDRCGTCDACLRACPTGAIVAPGVVDARRCISYWTIEHRGVQPAAVRAELGGWLFGCDACQTACPWNAGAPEADPARWRPQIDRVWPDILGWLRAAPTDLGATLRGSPMLRARPNGLRRNALVVLANTGQRAALPLVEALLEHDPDPVIRATSAWAAVRLGGQDALARAARDPHPVVRAEAKTP